MASNFLSSLGSMMASSAVAKQPNTIAHLIDSEIPEPAPLKPSVNNSIGYEVPNIVAAPTRPRRSVLDIIGGFADTLATVGGAQPLYQQNLDAQREREVQEENRQRELAMEPLRQKMLENQVRAGAQNIAAGDLEIQGARNELMNAAGAGMRQIFSRGGAKGLARAWPLAAQQLGVPPEQIEAIGQSLAADPQGTLDALFPQEAPKPQSLSKEAQIYKMLQESGTPEQADAYLQSLSNPDVMTPYQREQARLAREKFERDIYEFDNPQPTAAERKAGQAAGTAAQQRVEMAQAGRGMLTEMNDALERLKASGGILNRDQSTGGRIATILGRDIPYAEQLANPEAFSAREDLNRLATIGIPSLLPLLGGLTLGGKNIDAAKELDTWKNAILSARDYESAKRATSYIESRIRVIEQENPGAFNQSGSPKPRPRGNAGGRQIIRNEPTGQPRQAAPITRTIGGKNYVLRDGKWLEK
jgi:hypothetical protein